MLMNISNRLASYRDIEACHLVAIPETDVDGLVHWSYCSLVLSYLCFDITLKLKAL